MAYLDSHGLQTLWTKIKSHFGKQLEIQKSATAVDIKLKNAASTPDVLSTVTLPAAGTNNQAGVMTSAQAAKLEGIATGAEVNVQPNWDETDATSDAYIRNKPVIPDGAVIYHNLGQNTDGAIDQKVVTNELNAKEVASNKVTSWSSTTTDTNYPSEKLVKDSLDGKVPVTRTINSLPLSEDILLTASNIGGSIPSGSEPVPSGTIAESLKTLNTTKVDKVSGKGLSTNDYTTADKQLVTKLSDKTDSGSYTLVFRRSGTSEGGWDYIDTTDVIHEQGVTLDNVLYSKVDKVTGKGLSTNDYTTTEKNKLAGIEANANNYVHPTTSGNKHIPSGGSSGKILGWSADGTAAWIDAPDTGVTKITAGSNVTISPTGGTGNVTINAKDTTYVFNTAYNASTNKAATMSDINSAVAGNAKYKGTLASEAALTGLTNYKQGNYWVISSSWTSTAMGITLDAGNMIFANADGSTFAKAKFDVIQADIEAIPDSEINALN